MNETETGGTGTMKRRRETISGGRRIIYYTFGERAEETKSPQTRETDISGKLPQPEIKERENV